MKSEGARSFLSVRSSTRDNSSRILVHFEYFAHMLMKFCLSLLHSLLHYLMKLREV